MDGRRARNVLGVGNDAGPAEIRRAFRARALVTHPDQGGSRAEFAELLDAFESVSAPTKRQTAARVPIVARRLPDPVPLARLPFDAYDSPRRPAPPRLFADVLQAATARWAE